MPFRIAARTILQLGAELISSDGVAFYELIKNAFDAGTKSGVQIEVVIRIPYPDYRVLTESVAELSEDGRSFTSIFGALRTKCAAAVTYESTEASIAATIRSSHSKAELVEALKSANYIEVRDTGEGMSRHQLEEVYLTIGTRSRLDQRIDSKSERPILGEKGIGRLSAMRLGMRLLVSTTRAGEAKWNLLQIDWNDFAQSGSQLLGEVAVSPREGARKNDSEYSGTVIHISDLNSDWSFQRLREIANQDFSRLMDPFSRPPMRMQFRYNGDLVPLAAVNKLLFENADATVTARITNIAKTGEVPDFELRGDIDYRWGGRRKALHITQDHLLSIAGLDTLEELHRLGPFSMMCHWFNRRRLHAIEGIGDVKAVRAIVDQWGGGLMLFRDGFRVHPYGGPADDWLQLDPTAFRSTGYKVNRKQIIGKVDITSRANPLLIDQTNREGLRGNLQKEALVRLLQAILSNLRTFVTAVDDEKSRSEALDVDLLEQRVTEAESSLERTLEQLLAKYPKERNIAASITSVTEEIKEIMFQAKELAQGYENRESQLVHLAGIGLMVESIAHELNRSTQYTLSLLNATELTEVPEHVQRTLEGLESQLKTLQKRLRILDPLSTAGRQVKERFELVNWLMDLLAGHEAQFSRHDINCSLMVIPRSGELRIRAVKGMIVQVIENLISNSVYWLKRARKENPRFEPSIEVVVDCQQRQIRFTDNGPGVQRDQREDVFLPFVTTKPPHQGKGLGLYIAREIASYHGGRIYLSDKSTVHPDALNTFVFQLNLDER